VAHDPHLREVHRLTSGLDDLALEEREGREAPAGAAAALVLDRCGLDHLHVGELVARCGVVVGVGLCRCRESEAERDGGKHQSFHRR